MKETSPLAWDTQARYHLIELLAYWEGRVTAAALREAFQLGKDRAQQVLRTYREEVAVDNLVYDTSRKAWVPTSHFTPYFIRGHVDEYLHLLGTHDALNPQFVGLGLGAANTESVPMPIRDVSPEVVRAVVSAARERQRLEVVYASFSSPQGEDRLIAPHTLVYAAGRWHVRAYCEKNAAFRDFVLSRFRGVPEAIGDVLPAADPANDTAWAQRLTLEIIPDRRLSEAEQALIAQDYAMTARVLEITCRCALAQYVLREYGINHRHVEGDPRAQQIELGNREALRQWLY
ncbi:WYL domain-containing protein [Chromohalobacter nigrandesensis]|uniref:WYL domain-containing protein n=1 Tax=Chromohalobacter nigrandesensis TaxID=119863 RepID=UPI001FF65060|nr:WYL domain-containing protein [Chromohalobacter nigrandesensis]MCK0745103.1 WYL domain-containing protein [Chromohalobacter nigrandesensis]